MGQLGDITLDLLTTIPPNLMREEGLGNWSVHRGRFVLRRYQTGAALSRPPLTPPLAPTASLIDFSSYIPTFQIGTSLHEGWSSNSVVTPAGGVAGLGPTAAVERAHSYVRAPGA